MEPRVLKACAARKRRAACSEPKLTAPAARGATLSAMNPSRTASFSTSVLSILWGGGRETVWGEVRREGWLNEEGHGFPAHRNILQRQHHTAGVYMARAAGSARGESSAE